MRLPVFIFSLIALTSTAQVGIGTDAPSQALDIESADASQTAIDINNTSTGDPVINFQLAGSSTFSIGIDDDDADKFKIGTADIATSTALTIDGSQQIGIGTASPSQQLEVQGNVAIQNGTASSASLYLYENSTNGSDYVLLTVPADITTTYSFTLPVDAGTNGQVLVTNGSGTLGWVTASTGDLEASNNLSDVANAATARTNLGLAIGTDVQAYDADLADLADGSLTATKIAGGLVDDTEFDYLNGLTSSIQTQLNAKGAGDLLSTNNLSDVANAATARTNLGLVIGTDVQAYDADLADLADGSLTATKIAGGLVDDTEYDYLNGVTSAIQTQLDAKLVSANNLSDVANAATSRTNLGLAIGTDVQAYDADLDDLATGVFNEAGANVDFRIEGAGNVNLLYTDAGNDRVGINTAGPSRTFFVNGDAGGTTAWFNDSDERLKKNITTIESPLVKVLALRGVNYEWKDTTNRTAGLQMGFIAQETEMVVPELVAVPTSDSAYYSMQYAPITALLVEAVKEQQTTINVLNAKILQLETAAVQSSNTESTNDYNALLERIQALEALLIEKKELTVAK